MLLKENQIGLGKKITSHETVKDQLTADYDYKDENVVEDG